MMRFISLTSTETRAVLLEILRRDEIVVDRRCATLRVSSRRSAALRSRFNDRPTYPGVAVAHDRSGVALPTASRITDSRCSSTTVMRLAPASPPRRAPPPTMLLFLPPAARSPAPGPAPGSGGKVLVLPVAATGRVLVLPVAAAGRAVVRPPAADGATGRAVVRPPATDGGIALDRPPTLLLLARPSTGVTPDRTTADITDRTLRKPT